MVQEVEECRLPQMAGPGGGANAESSSERIEINQGIYGQDLV